MADRTVIHNYDNLEFNKKIKMKWKKKVILNIFEEEKKNNKDSDELKQRIVDDDFTYQKHKIKKKP